MDFLAWNSACLHGSYQVWKRNQEDDGNRSFTAMCSYDNWRMAWYAFINLLHVNTLAEFTCDICETLAEILVYDATSLGFQRKFSIFQKHPYRGVLRKGCSENMHHFYRRTPTLKCDFNKVAKQFYWNRTSVWCSPINLLHIFRTPFLMKISWWLLLKSCFYTKTKCRWRSYPTKIVGFLWLLLIACYLLRTLVSNWL